jgi:ribonuclease HII
MTSGTTHRGNLNRGNRITSPTLRVERSIIRNHGGLLLVADEVGRGSYAGPVTCGVVIIEKDTPHLKGVRDSKLLTPRMRGLLVEPIRSWCVAWGVGHASAAEIDDVGMTAALRIAVHRAAEQTGMVPAAVLIDGNVDWYSLPGLGNTDSRLPVYTRVKADVTCTAVAAASIIAKETRDQIMRDLAADNSQYNWEANKGYLTSGHLKAIREHGLSEHHRRSWRLPQ